MTTALHIYLVPGFFGFANFGDFAYFGHVRDELERQLVRRQRHADVHFVRTIPTGSLRRRTGRLLDEIARTAKAGREPIHIIGHSTGGLDARLLVATGAIIDSSFDPAPWVRRVRSVTSVCTPHAGTPSASFFTSVMGQRVLRLLSVATIHAIRFGTIPLPALLYLADAVSPLRRPRVPTGLFDQVYEQVVRDFSAERREALDSFFAEVGAEQSLLTQLTVESLDLFNSVRTDNPRVRYGSGVCRTRRPSTRRMLRLGMSPALLANYALFRALHRVASGLDTRNCPTLSEAQRQALVRAFGDVPDPSDNDAIVPTRSQVHGEVLAAAWGDHLDVIGHFGDPRSDPPRVDWLRTQSAFDRGDFERIWSAVVDFMLR
jgi:pimeloyl-ACP methyl ester carboxylesterase